MLLKKYIVLIFLQLLYQNLLSNICFSNPFVSNFNFPNLYAECFQDLRELFSLPEQGFDISLTQQQMHKEHDYQHIMYNTKLSWLFFSDNAFILCTVFYYPVFNSQLFFLSPHLWWLIDEISMWNSDNQWNEQLTFVSLKQGIFCLESVENIIHIVGASYRVLFCNLHFFVQGLVIL